MRGWHRIGVVLSVLWFVGFGGWMWVSSTHEIGEFYGTELIRCYRNSEMRQESLRRDDLRRDDPQYDQRVEKIDAEEKACKDQASAFFHRRWEEHRADAWIFIAIDVASLALFWLLAWIVVSVGRWVAAGFRH